MNLKAIFSRAIHVAGVGLHDAAEVVAVTGVGSPQAQLAAKAVLAIGAIIKHDPTPATAAPAEAPTSAATTPES